MNTHKTFRYYIGIDAGVKTGFAIWDSPNKKFIMVESMMIHQAWRIIENKLVIENCFFKVEDARQATWARSSKKDDLSRMLAGSIKRDAKFWEDYLTDRNANFIMVRPAKAFTKWKSDLFARTTGWKPPTNEHGRDAAMLVFNS